MVCLYSKLDFYQLHLINNVATFFSCMNVVKESLVGLLWAVTVVHGPEEQKMIFK